MLKPFFTYYGGKHSVALQYPAPAHDIIIEPFAGSAGYATKYPDRAILLIEKDPKIAALWDYLIRVSEQEIRALPDIRENVDEVRTCAEAQSLVGFWLNTGAAQPGRTPSNRMRKGLRPKSHWGPEIRERIASQVNQIRHWRVLLGSYSDAPHDLEATWFVDPPYQKAGVHYKHGSRTIDFDHLAGFCKSRIGQTIVCENDGASWLPFIPFRKIVGSQRRRGVNTSIEAVWVQNT